MENIFIGIWILRVANGKLAKFKFRLSLDFFTNLSKTHCWYYLIAASVTKK